MLPLPWWHRYWCSPSVKAGSVKQRAIKQLLDLAKINLQQNNMEGYLAVQQEIVRRYPAFEEARTAAEALGGSNLVVKAQVHAGGRGKGTFKNGFKGGVHLCDTPEKAREQARAAQRVGTGTSPE